MSTRIERPESEVGEPKASGALTSVDGVETGTLCGMAGACRDPRTASLEEAAEILQAIIDSEGPVLESRAYQTYVRASGIQRLGPQIRRVLNLTLTRLERRKRVVVERSAGGSGYRNAVLRTPETDRVKLRDIGPEVVRRGASFRTGVVGKGCQILETGCQICQDLPRRFGDLRTRAYDRTGQKTVRGSRETSIHRCGDVRLFGRYSR